MKTKKPMPNVAQVYEEAHFQARVTLDRISDLLFDMPAPDDENPHRIDWGHVGSIGHVNDLLNQVVNFLTNSDD